MRQPDQTASTPRRLPRIAAVASFVLAACSVLAALWATADRDWEQSWEDRVRVETPLGASKNYVMAWIGQNCEYLPHASPKPCLDNLGNIPMVQLAGIDETAASSYVMITVRRNDVAAGETDHMRIYYFFGDEDRVIGHYYLPFHELAQFERAYKLLASPTDILNDRDDRTIACTGVADPIGTQWMR